MWSVAVAVAQNELDRGIYRHSRERGDDPRDALLNDLDLPRGLERELVLEGVYELSGKDSRTLAAVGAFRATISIRATTLSPTEMTAWSTSSKKVGSHSMATTAASS
jgi:hypothetical protein